MNYPKEIYADTDLVCGEEPKDGHEKYIRSDEHDKLGAENRRGFGKAKIELTGLPDPALYDSLLVERRADVLDYLARRLISSPPRFPLRAHLRRHNPVSAAQRVNTTQRVTSANLPNKHESLLFGIQ